MNYVITLLYPPNRFFLGKDGKLVEGVSKAARFDLNEGIKRVESINAGGASYGLINVKEFLADKI